MVNLLMMIFQLVTEYVDNLNVLFDNLNVDNRIGIGPEIFIQQHMVTNFDREQILSFQIMKLNIKYTKGFLVLRTNPWRPVINRQ
jgi:tyrosine-protein phosphatase YwqE